MSKSRIVIFSPFLIIAINFLVAIIAGDFIGKWAFIPIILIEWGLFAYFILKFSPKGSIKKWLSPLQEKWYWNLLALLMGLITLPIFLMHYELLSPFTIWLPWLILALVNPFLEEFYWRGLLIDHTSKWPIAYSILFSTMLFSANHAVFGVNSEINSGIEIIISTFIMGLVWAVVYQKTKSLRWTILGHILVDAFSLSTPAFLDLFQKHSF